MKTLAFLQDSKERLDEVDQALKSNVVPDSWKTSGGIKYPNWLVDLTDEKDKERDLRWMVQIRVNEVVPEIVVDSEIARENHLEIKASLWNDTAEDYEPRQVSSTGKGVRGLYEWHLDEPVRVILADFEENWLLRSLMYECTELVLADQTTMDAKEYAETMPKHVAGIRSTLAAMGISIEEQIKEAAQEFPEQYLQGLCRKVASETGQDVTCHETETAFTISAPRHTETVKAICRELPSNVKGKMVCLNIGE